jgi:hypothetical protein
LSAKLHAVKNKYCLSLIERANTEADGIAQYMELKAEEKVNLEVVLKFLESKISEIALFKL